MKAFKVTLIGQDDAAIVVAETSGKARYKAFLSARDVFDKLRITELRVIRAPEFDGIPALLNCCYGIEYASRIKLEQVLKPI